MYSCTNTIHTQYQILLLNQHDNKTSDVLQIHYIPGYSKWKMIFQGMGCLEFLPQTSLLRLIRSISDWNGWKVYNCLSVVTCVMDSSKTVNHDHF